MYRESDNVRRMRCLDNVHLVDFVNLPLKSNANFETALDILQRTSMGEYMSRYAVPIPGDCPAQFHVRKAVYSRCGFQAPADVHANDLEKTSTSSNDGTTVYNNGGLHHYSMSTTYDCGMKLAMDTSRTPCNLQFL